MGWSTLNVRSRYSFLGIALFKASAYKHRLVCQFACLSVSAIAFFCCFFRIKLAYNKPRKVTMPNFWEKIFLWKNSRFWDFRLFFCGNEAISRQKIKKSKIWRIELWRSIFCRSQPNFGPRNWSGVEFLRFWAIFQKQQARLLRTCEELQWLNG